MFNAKTKLMLVISAVLTCAMLLPGAASARGTEYNEAWSFEFVPYLWFFEVDGEVTARGYTTPITTDFFDMIDNSGGNLHLEAWNTGWALILDFQYLEYVKDLPSETGLSRIRTTSYTYEFGLARTLLDSPTTLEALAGGRWLELDTHYRDPIGSTLERERDLFDTFVGLRLGHDITERLDVFVRSDIGGFGLGSDLTWNASAMIGYRMFPSVSVLTGYRILDIDDSDGQDDDLFVYDIQTKGMVIAVAISL